MKTIYLFIVFTFLLSCKSDEKENVKMPELNGTELTRLSSNRPNLNVSILLDLSDRIDTTKYPNSAMEYYQRDLGYINSIANSFELHLRNKRSIKINDHIKLFIDPEPSDKDLNQKLDVLNMIFTKDNAKKEKILQISNKYDSISRLIYETALNDKNYVGSDIWRFFKTKVKDFCIEPGHRNILVILTDGYIYHKDNVIKDGKLTTYLRPQDIRDNKLTSNNWLDTYKKSNYGFIPANSNLESLEVLVLGINPDPKNPYELEVINKYWNDWLAAMGVIHYDLKMAELPSNLDKLIQEYILKD